MRLFSVPDLPEALDGFRSGVDDQFFWQKRLCGQMAKLIGTQLDHLLSPGKIEGSGVLALYVGNGRHQIVGRRERGNTPVSIDQRPVLEVHVAIADQCAKHEATNELG